MMMWGSTIPLLPTANLLTAFNTSNFLSGKLIVLVLIGASATAWVVMLTKYFELAQAQRETNRFQLAFRRESYPLTLFIRRQVFSGSPLHQVYLAGCAAIGGELDASGRATSDLFVSESERKRIELTPLQVEVVRRVTERTVSDQILLLEDRMGFLMTAVSVSPLLGLLGTVWGVLDAFGAMALRGSANISAVAPGISSALLTTVVGLLVAIPSTVGYNLLAGRIRKLSVQMDNFGQEFVSDLQRTFSR
ncbi:MAG: MotA/TolQ/ExbB proton channel family protein [Kiritimatiellia bacterium]|nr:MotA/TolQ/ExbB proton channel family protein [Kiritimatiellia bacterium]